jgi:regulator of sigma E protease
MTILIGIICLSIVVFAHELGHFVAARASGIAVERFSIGIGRRLIGFTRKGTDYCISLLPIGGFCKMKGEDSFQKALGRGEEIVVHEPGSFYAAHPVKRIFVAFMGPFFNFLFAVAALSIVSAIGYSVQSPGNTVILSSSYPELDSPKSTLPSPSPAQRAGLQDGDRILSVDGKTTDFYFQIQEAVSKKAGKSISILVDRGGRRIELEAVPALDRSTGAGRIGIYPLTEPLVSQIVADGAAARAGLRSGDLILKANERPIKHTVDFSSALASKPSKVVLAIQRSGAETTLTLYPDYGEGDQISIGFTFKAETYRSPRMNALEALTHGATAAVTDLGDIFTSVRLLFQKVDMTETVAGPARIVYMVGGATQEGFKAGFASGVTTALNILSLVSLSLLFTNLLPIPLLDGGLIIIFAIEAIRKKALKPKALYRVTMAGFFLVALIFLFSVFNDILFFFFKK